MTNHCTFPYSEGRKKGIDLLDSMLAMDPARRPSAADALDSDFFWSLPPPCEPHQ